MFVSVFTIGHCCFFSYFTPWFLKRWIPHNSKMTKILLIKFNKLQILHLRIYKLYPLEKVEFWLTVRMCMRYHGKLDHIQTAYLCFSTLLHIDKTDSEVEMRLHMSAYSTTTSACSISFSWNYQIHFCLLNLCVLILQ